MPDTVAPSTTASAPAGWVRGPASVSLSATDTHTWVAGTRYRVNGAAVSTYTAPVSVSAEGTNTIEYASVDGAGNNEATSTVTVRVDNTAPVSTDDAPTEWATGPVTVHLLATDAISGVASTRYVLDGAEAIEGTSVTISEDGTHTITYASTDVAGNTEATSTARSG